MTRKGEVKLKVWSRRGTRIERTVAVDLVENAAGRVFVEYDDEGAAIVKVEVTDVGAAGAFMKETRLVLRPDRGAPVLRGKATPKRQAHPLDAGLHVTAFPLLRELYDGAIALEVGLDAAREAIRDGERGQEATPARE